MKEINKVVRDYILNDVNQTLARLGISEKVMETKEYPTQSALHYNFESKPIRQFPVMFKEVIVTGDISDITFNTDDAEIIVTLRFAYRNWDGGMNGCNIGTIHYQVRKEMPDDVTENHVDIYIKRLRGLLI